MLSASCAVRPIESPPKNSPTAQPASAARWSRRASPTGRVSPRAAVGGPGRGRSRPGAVVAAGEQREGGDRSSAAVKRGRARAATSARRRTAASPGPSRSATARRASRRRRRRRRAARTTRRARRRPARRRRPVALADLDRDRGDAARTGSRRAASEAPSAIEPATGVSAATITSAVAAPISSCASAATTSAAVSGAARPTTLARTSSLRPLCSSPRVCRPTMNMLISAATTAPKAPHCHATSPPTLVTASGGPTIAIRPGLLATVAT